MATTPLCHLRTRHAEGMLLVAAIWALIGLGVITSPATSPPPPSVWHALIPTPVIATLWIVPAIIAGYIRHAVQHVRNL